MCCLMNHRHCSVPLLLFCLSIRLWTGDCSSVAGQETLLGVVGPDFIMLGADSSSSTSIALTASNLDKILVVADPFPEGRDGRSTVDGPSAVATKSPSDERLSRGSHRRSTEQQTIAAAAAGDAADSDRLLGILSAHAAVREYEAGIGCDVECVFDGGGAPRGSASPAGLDAEAIACLARGEIASSLRSGAGQLRVCLLIAGMVRSAGALGNESDQRRARAENDQDEHDELKTHSSLQERKRDENAADPSFSGRIRRQVEAGASEYRKSQKVAFVSKDKLAKSTPALDPSSRSIRNPYLEPRLFWLDEYGSLQNLEYGAHGFGANFALSVLDRGYRPNLSREEAAELIRDCFRQLRTRYVINSPEPPCIKCVDADGCRLVR